MSGQVSAFGDWHGSGGYAVHALSIAGLLRPEARFVHVGDMGLWPGSVGDNYLRDVNHAVDTYGQDLYVVPGNHEHWPSLCIGSALGFDDSDEDGFLVTPHYPRLHVAPRVNTWEWDGLLYASLSGANSIDFQHRTEGRSWWPEESPTDDHVDALVDAVDGRRVDVLFTHDAPLDAIEALNLYPSGSNHDWSPQAIAYARESSRVVASARSRLLPRIHVCGHHHVRRSCLIDGTQVVILSDDGAGSMRGNRLDIDDGVIVS